MMSGEEVEDKEEDKDKEDQEEDVAVGRVAQRVGVAALSASIPQVNNNYYRPVAYSIQR